MISLKLQSLGDVKIALHQGIIASAVGKQGITSLPTHAQHHRFFPALLAVPNFKLSSCQTFNLSR